MKTIITKNNWLKESDLRMDASYHLSDGVFTTHLIKSSKVKYDSLENLTSDIFMGPRFKRYYVSNPEYGVPFMGGSDMQKSSFSGLKLISKRMTKEIQQLYLKRGWILITRSGTIGQSVFTNEEYEGKTATEDVIRVIANKEKIKPGYLYAFLSSKYGYALLTQGTYGAVIQHIEPHHIKHLPIPLIPEEKQQQIHDLIIEASKLRVDANKSMHEVHEIFRKYVFKKKDYSKVSKTKIATINSKLHKRLDSSFYINSEYYESLFNDGLIKKYLGDFVSRNMFTAQRGKRNYVNKNGIRFLSTSDISQLNPLRINKFLSLKTDGLETLIVKEDWILVSSSGQEILGSAFYVDKSYSNCAVNQHSIRVIIDKNKISPHYIYGYLSMPEIKEYIRSGIYGSAVLTINEDFLSKLIVPILDIKASSEIEDKIKVCIENRQISNEKELQAIEIIENEISSWQKL